MTGKSQGDEIIIPFKNLINDAYCRDISIKIRSHLDVKRKNGEYIGAFVPYGYEKSDDDKHKLVIDIYAAGRAQGAVIRPDFYRMKNRYGVQSRSAGFLKMRFTLEILFKAKERHQIIK